MRLLPNTHLTPETAFVVLDYPYGFRLRCQIRYWIEYNGKRGFRFWSQTTDPKRGNVWNKPKSSTYFRFGGAMYLDENAHVQFAGLSEYSTGIEAAAWCEKFGDAVPVAGWAILHKWTAAKLAYDAARRPNDALSVGLIEARTLSTTPNSPMIYSKGYRTWIDFALSIALAFAGTFIITAFLIAR